MTIITTEMEAEIIRLFNRFDVDSNGLSDLGKFRTILRSVGDDSGKEAMDLKTASIDTDQDDMVAFR